MKQMVSYFAKNVVLINYEFEIPIHFTDDEVFEIFFVTRNLEFSEIHFLQDI